MGMLRPVLSTSASTVNEQPTAPEVAPHHPALFPRWWLWPLAAYVLLRVADAVMILVASRHAGHVINQYMGTPLNYVYGGGRAPAGYLTTATNWDGQWYWQIVDKGYPAQLPRSAAGHVLQNTWAFFPAYPMTVRLVMAITGLGFPLAAVLVSLTCGAVATLLIYRLVAPVTDRLGARLLVVMVNAFVCAPALQIAYSEGLAFALLAASLVAFKARRVGLTAVLVLALSLTRGVVLPLAAVFGIVAIARWRRGAGRTEVIATSALAVWALATTFLWPAIAGLVTGEPKAYLLTQASWNPNVTTLPVVRFINRVSGVGVAPALAAALAALMIAGVVLVVTVGQRHQLLRLWSGIYALYVLAALDWNSTIIRYFLLAVPAVWAPVDPLTDWPRAHRIWMVAAVAVAGLAGQWWWIRYSLTVSPEFYQVP